MSVQVRRRREAAAYLSTFVGAQGELLVDTTNNRVQVHDGATPGGWPAAKLADIVQRTAVADANYTALPSDRTVAFTALTAARTVTLPAASAYPTGTQLLVVDEAGACSSTNTMTLARAGTNTINGTASFVLGYAYGYVALESNGVGKWTIVDQTIAGASGGSGVTAAQLVGHNAAINGNFAINQRAYASGTALAAGAYGHDRFKAGASGCTYTFTQGVPDTTVTITAGSLIQAVDAPNVYATTWWLTWTGTAQARVWQGTASGSFSAGTSASIGGVTVNTLMVSALTVGMIANLEFQGGSVGLVQFEAAVASVGPTRFERRHNETLLCQRYYITTGSYQVKIGTYAAAGGATFDIGTIFFPVTMRAVPTVTMTSTLGNAQQQTPDSAFTSPFAFVLQGNLVSAGTLSGGGSYTASAEI